LVASAHDDPLVEVAVGLALARDLVAAPLVTHLVERTGGHYLQKHAVRELADWLALRTPLLATTTPRWRADHRNPAS
jgi:hypothetical protein